jgi:diguanylate cyclase (GGDEF)-like protein
MKTDGKSMHLSGQNRESQAVHLLTENILTVREVAAYLRLTETTLPHQEPLTLSFGVAYFPNHGTTMEELIRNADLSLYQSKQAGKNRYTFYAE